MPVLAILLLLAKVGSASEASVPADLILVSANIWTGDAANPAAQALAVREGRIVAIGSNAEIERFRGPSTRVLEGKGRRVVVWGINYAPEITGIAPHNVAFCEFLQRSGDDVEVVTTFAYYPAWRKNPEDRNRLSRTDEINGVRVHRCWHYVPRRVSAWKRILHEGTFVFTSTIRALRLNRRCAPT